LAGHDHQPDQQGYAALSPENYQYYTPQKVGSGSAAQSNYGARTDSGGSTIHECEARHRENTAEPDGYEYQYHPLSAYSYLSNIVKDIEVLEERERKVQKMSRRETFRM
jgi:hypothetical protein